MEKENKIIALTLGDPLGIGNEIIYKALKQYKSNYTIVILGQKIYYKDKYIKEIKNISQIKEKGIYFYEVPIIDKDTKNDPSFHYVQTAINFANNDIIQAIVTGPISKERWKRAGHDFNGHTDLLAKQSKTKNHVMFFWSDDLKVALFTIHIPLKEIFQHVNKKKIIDFIQFLNYELYKLFHIRFNFLVSGLNPHAGEDGFMGTEEKDIIIPAIQQLKAEMNIQGPFPPDTIFLKAKDQKDSVVISWYHDQGLIAFKLLNIHKGVNLTLGLPFIRTSPDHGTAFDIAGTDKANPSSMIEAIQLAEQLLDNT